MPRRTRSFQSARLIRLPFAGKLDSGLFRNAMRCIFLQWIPDCLTGDTRWQICDRLGRFQAARTEEDHVSEGHGPRPSGLFRGVAP